MNIAVLHCSVPPFVGRVESVIGHHAQLMAAARKLLSRLENYPTGINDKQNHE